LRLLPKIRNKASFSTECSYLFSSPLLTQQGTYRCVAPSEAMGQQETHATQQMAFAFNDRIGAGEQ